MGEAKKSINELMFPDNIYYYHEHTWAKQIDDQVLIGITDFAQDQLGEIIFIELPSVGDAFKAGDIFGQAESAKSVSSLYLPVSGKIAVVNDNVDGNPELINHSPYEDGWLIIVEPEDMNEVQQMLSKENYINLLKE